MDQPLKPFTYRLASLLRRDRWERDLVGGELQRAQVLVEQSLQRWQAAALQVSAAEAQMRELHAQDRPIALESRRLLYDFLTDAHVTMAARLDELKHAHGLLEQLRSQLEVKRVAVRTLEKHRDRQQLGHDLDQSRRAQRSADESWLTRERRR